MKTKVRIIIIAAIFCACKYEVEPIESEMVGASSDTIPLLREWDSVAHVDPLIVKRYVFTKKSGRLLNGILYYNQSGSLNKDSSYSYFSERINDSLYNMNFAFKNNKIDSVVLSYAKDEFGKTVVVKTSYKSNAFVFKKDSFLMGARNQIVLYASIYYHQDASDRIIPIIIVNLDPKYKENN